HLSSRLVPQLVRRAARPPNHRQRPTVRRREGYVGFRVAPVDADDQRFGHAHARCFLFSWINRSASCSASGHWPISGWARSASVTRRRPPRTAASTANSSYADTWAISPRAEAGSVGAGTNSIVPLPTAALASMTASDGRKSRAPALRAFTACTPPREPSNDDTSSTADSEYSAPPRRVSASGL